MEGLTKSHGKKRVRWVALGHPFLKIQSTRPTYLHVRRINNPLVMSFYLNKTFAYYKAIYITENTSIDWIKKNLRSSQISPTQTYSVIYTLEYILSIPRLCVYMCSCVWCIIQYTHVSSRHISKHTDVHTHAHPYTHFSHIIDP